MIYLYIQRVQALVMYNFQHICTTIFAANICIRDHDVSLTAYSICTLISRYAFFAVCRDWGALLDRCLPKQVSITRAKRDWEPDILSRYRALVGTLSSSCPQSLETSIFQEEVIKRLSVDPGNLTWLLVQKDKANERFITFTKPKWESR